MPKTAATKELNVGDAAPAFTLQDQNGKKVSSSDFKGKWIVLYFYPKDDTPGCTKEACSFRDNIKTLQKKNAVILGVSPDSPESHVKFIQKFNLPFTLLADTEKTVCKAYGVWKLKSFMGKEYMGVERTTFVIDSQGRIAKIFPKVQVDGHTEEVLAALGE